MPLIERFRSQAHSAMKLPGFIFPHVEFRFAAWIQDIMLIYHRMPILFLFENKIHTPICTRMSCSFLKVGAKASDNLTAVEVGSFSSKVLTTFVGPYSTRIWRWLVICRWERWPFWLLVIVMTLKNFLEGTSSTVVQWIFMKIVSLYSTWEGWGFPVSVAMLVFWRVVVVADHCFWSTRWEWGIILERECL